LPPEAKTEDNDQIRETLVKLNEIIDALAQQTDIVRVNRERWLRSVLEMQKSMAYRVDLFRGLEEELSLEKKIVQDIVDVHPPKSVHIPDAIRELHELSFGTLKLIGEMHISGDPKLIPKILSSNYSFKMNLFNYIDYLESELKNWAGAGLEKFRMVLEDRDNLDQQSPHILKAET